MRRTRFWQLLAVAVGALLLVSACGDDEVADTEPEEDEDAAADPEEDDSAEAGEDDADTGDRPFEGETLTVLNWQDFGSDTEYAIEGFEERTGATVEHVYHSSGEELRETLRTGGIGEIDVTNPNFSFLQQMVEEDMLQPLDADRIPNLEHVYDDFMDSEELYAGDELYGAPWIWGSTGLTYNTDHFDEEPTSWEVLWDEEWEGQVGFMDSPIEAIMLTALYLGEDPHDPDLGAVEEALIDMRPNVELYWSSFDDWNRAFTTESISVGNFWAGDAGRMMEEGEPVGYTIPEEGAVGWIDAWTVIADAPNPELAHEWIDWMISEEFLSEWAEDPEGGAPAPANELAAEGLSDAAQERIQDDAEDVDNLAIMSTLSQEEQQEYTDLLSQVKAGAE
ncbi:extracellular solute-binding protein [Egibacter rhizosphaerae]|uniref:Extracellular solute-binding protein n=1 Tax=Egibacter rhizosphaerae TaxID=1670831 RepID=A0A411YED0_9ACTN|nr:extracellular solute-binding protein [Egibacter rhizosphaerae]QBI19482.1 extracellular solute-binding protein [Egibacter rhizosphaerae]